MTKKWGKKEARDFCLTTIAPGEFVCFHWNNYFRSAYLIVLKKKNHFKIALETAYGRFLHSNQSFFSSFSGVTDSLHHLTCLIDTNAIFRPDFVLPFYWLVHCLWNILGVSVICFLKKYLLHQKSNENIVVLFFNYYFLFIAWNLKFQIYQWMYVSVTHYRHISPFFRQILNK